jgi:HlyD family secretion protein
MKKLLPILIILAAAGGAYYYFSNGKHGNPNELVVSGNIELSEVSIGFKTAGKLMERAVNEGDKVEKGQVLARLDHDQLLAQRAQQEAALAAARSQLAQSETGTEWQRQTQNADLALKSAEINSAEAKLADLKSGARPEEKLEAKAAVDVAQSEADRTKRDWDRAQTLHKNDDISTAQFDQFRSQFENAAAALRKAKEREALILAGARKEEIAYAAAQLERAKAARQGSQANELEIKRRSQELTSRRAELTRIEAAIKLIDTQIAETVATAPVSGVVLVKSADAGEILAAGTTILTIGDIDHPWLRGYINETDLSRIKLGSKARITTDSTSGKTYEGKVTFIASEAEFTPKQIQTQQERVKLVYRIKISVENPAHELKSNMPADAVILLD